MFPNSCKVLSTITFNGGKLFCTIAETAASYATAAETEAAEHYRYGRLKVYNTPV